ncbi:MAG: hypothetical protein FWD84_01390, partial [Oscillospiraceae bacterium]|nr:hypothetical protein [Oscillospiraceae bacterium]
MTRKRILCSILLLGLVLALLPGTPAAAETAVNVFSVEAPTGVAYDGYLVSVRPGARARMGISPLSVGMEEVVENIYMVDCLADVQRAFRADQILYIEPNFEITLFHTP